MASLHAIKDVGRAGVFADPHPAAVGSGSAADKALAADTDALALDMARRVAGGGGHVAGNKLGTAGETSLYPGQNPKLSADQIEKENKKGTTFGQWAPSRGIGVITIEMPEQHDTTSPVTDPGRPAEIESRAEALEEIFLGPPPGSNTAAAIRRIIEGAKAVGGAIVGGAQAAGRAIVEEVRKAAAAMGIGGGP